MGGGAEGMDATSRFSGAVVVRGVEGEEGGV